jgi:ectoine hydroxylase-related dioxygenase (phytanoyl-CoA dioxygenase family)
MVAVNEHGIEGYFSNPSMASGIPLVKAPRDLLERMLTVRIHLDDMTEGNGPLRVLGGSHNYYEMAEDDSTEPLTITCNAGDVLLMRPLLNSC